MWNRRREGGGGGGITRLPFAASGAAEDDQENDDEESDQNHKDLPIAQLPALVFHRVPCIRDVIENFPENLQMLLFSKNC